MKTKLSLYLCCALLFVGVLAMREEMTILTAVCFAGALITGIYYFTVIR